MTDGSDRAAMIEADNLSKFYGDFTACRDVTFTINRGEVAAFLGPNGAGKTSTMQVLLGFQPPSKGAAYIFGVDVREPIARQRIGCADLARAIRAIDFNRHERSNGAAARPSLNAGRERIKYAV